MEEIYLDRFSEGRATNLVVFIDMLGGYRVANPFFRVHGYLGVDISYVAQYIFYDILSRFGREVEIVTNKNFINVDSAI